MWVFISNSQIWILTQGKAVWINSLSPALSHWVSIGNMWDCLGGQCLAHQFGSLLRLFCVFFVAAWLVRSNLLLTIHCVLIVALLPEEDLVSRVITGETLSLRRVALISTCRAFRKRSLDSACVLEDLEHMLIGFHALLRELFILEFNWDYGRVTHKCIVSIESGLSLMALSAEWHVHVVSTNHVLDVFVSCAKGEAGILFAKLADGWQLLDLFAFRD